jgi:hypothetical protein
VRAAWITACLLLAGGTGGGAYLLAGQHGKASLAPVASTAAPVARTGTSPVTQASGVTSAPASSATTAPATTPPVTQQQAAGALAGLLASSASQRSAIDSAYGDAANCGGGYPQDARAFRDAAASRRSLIGQLAALPGRQTLPAGMLSDLRGAWQASATADDDYARWADDEASGGCTTSDSWYSATGAPNQQATAGKMAFTAAWNPIAQRYGLPTYTQSEL